MGVSQVLGLAFGLVVVVISYSSNPTIFSDLSFILPGICAGFLGYCGLACLYAGLATGSMGVVSPISALSAVIPLTYAVMHGEKLSLLTSIGIIFALAGAFCASGPELSAGLPIRPLLLAVGAACGFGTALTFIAIGSQTSALMTMVTMRLATFIVTIGLAIKFKTLGGFAAAEFPGLIFMGIADFLANLLLGVACNNGSVSVAMVLGSFYPIATALLAFRFLKERLHVIQYIGVVLAVTGVALISAF